MLAAGDARCVQGVIARARVACSVEGREQRGHRKSAIGDRYPERRFRGGVPGCELQVYACEERFHGYCSKCLQVAVVEGMKGVMHERAARALQRACLNDDAAGYNGTVREALNLEGVRPFLIAENVYAHVYESASAEALTKGDLEGQKCWALSLVRTSLVWFGSVRKDMLCGWYLSMQLV